MGAHGSKQRPAKSERNGKKGVEKGKDPAVARQWSYLPVPAYAFVIGGQNMGEECRMRFPTAVAAFHGSSLTTVPNDPPPLDKIKYHGECAAVAAQQERERRQKERAQHAMARQRGDRSDRHVFGAEDSPWPHVEDLRIAVVDREHHRVLVFDEKGALVHSSGRRGTRSVRAGEFTDPRGAFFSTRMRELLVTDNNLSHIGAPRWQGLRYTLADENTRGALEAVRKWGNKEEIEDEAKEEGRPVPRLHTPWGIAMGVKGEQVIVSDYELHCIHVFQMKGNEVTYLGKFGSRGSGPGELYGPRGIAVDSVNNVVVADCHNHRVQVFSPDARSLGCVEGLSSPSDVAVDDKDNIIVADTGSHSIKVFAPTGGPPLAVYGGRRSFGEPGYFNAPMGVDIFVRFRYKDGLKRWGAVAPGTKIKSDDDRVLVVADTGNHAVQLLTVWQQDPSEMRARLKEAGRKAAATHAKEQRSRDAARAKVRNKKQETAGKKAGKDGKQKSKAGK